MDPMEKVLRRLTRTPGIRDFLRENYPAALQEAEHAIPVSGLELQNDDLDRMVADWRALREYTDTLAPDERLEQEPVLRAIQLIREVRRHAEGAENDVRVRMISDWAVEMGFPPVFEEASA